MKWSRQAEWKVGHASDVMIPRFDIRKQTDIYRSIAFFFSRLSGCEIRIRSIQQPLTAEGQEVFCLEIHF